MVLETSIATTRERHFVSWGWVLGIAATAAFAVGSVAWTTSAEARADLAAIASASASAAASPPVQSQPQSDLSTVTVKAGPMTDAAWSQVDASWDVLQVAALGDGGPATRGVYALYLTPPGGERRLAFARDGIADSTPSAVAWDPEALIMLLATAANEFRVADMRTGAYTPLESPVAGEVADIAALGRASNGLNYIAIYQGESYEEVQVAAWDATGWHGVTDVGESSVSPLKGDIAILNQGGELKTLDVVTGERGQPLSGLAGCSFKGWATATEFSAACMTSPQTAEVFGKSITDSEPAQDLGPYAPLEHLWPGVPLQLAGTPFVLQSREGEVEVLVLTDTGLHSVDRVTADREPVGATLASDSRWVLYGSYAFPLVVDARRGTLDDIGEGFRDLPGTVSFLPGARD